MARQPLLHDLLVALSAPTQAWSAPDGQIRPRGAQGIFHGDVRALSRVELTVDGEEPEVISAGPDGPGAVRVVALARGIDGEGADPTTRLERRRSVTPGVVAEEITLSCATAEPVTGTVRVVLGADLAPMDVVKAGGSRQPLAATADAAGARWTDGQLAVLVAGDGATVDLTDPATPTLTWSVTADPGGAQTLRWRAEVADPGAVVGPPPGAEPLWSTPTVDAGDVRLAELLDRSLEDLAGLRMSAAFAPGETFLAAGAPWFFTLFGRDSLWAARMLLPLGTELAGGTLRTLAAVQGTKVDVMTAEQPGKIVHEIRRATQDLDDGTQLPPTYYGTIDATPLWVCLLHDAWRWGMPEGEVEALLPAMERALGWMAEYGDADGDGFLEYIDASGHGLANQGWKDSSDSVQWRDGSLAEGTIALCEVQGYAYEAAVAGAALLEAFGRPGAPEWRAWAERLARRFREAFWVSDTDGAYPAIALDGTKRPVDGVSSNMGHLLGTGLLTHDEEERVARRLVSPAMASGYGLRTLAEGSGGYWPLRYHGGTVWPHDTAITVQALSRAGFGAEAAALAGGLLAAAPSVGYRLPELFSGDGLGSVPAVVPYPASCRPQAWSAASAVVVLSTALGLSADVPHGQLVVAPALGHLGHLRAWGLRVADRSLDVAVGPDGEVTTSTDAPVEVVVRR